MKHTYLFLILLTLFACETEDEQILYSELSGTWILSEVLADPGDGSGQFMPVDSDETLSFDGRTVTISSAFCGNVTTAPYSLETNTISPSCTSGTREFQFEYFDNELILYHDLCIEGCASKYRRITRD